MLRSMKSLTKYPFKSENVLDGFLQGTLCVHYAVSYQNVPEDFQVISMQILILCY